MENTDIDNSGRINGEILPSNPNFDRTGITDEEYIEQLKFENMELRAVVASQTTIIKTLRDQLDGSSEKEDYKEVEEATLPIVSKKRYISSSTLAEDHALEAPEQAEEPPSVPLEDIPQRSSRRRAVNSFGNDSGVSNDRSFRIDVQMEASEPQRKDKMDTNTEESNRSSLYSVEAENQSSEKREEGEILADSAVLNKPQEFDGVDSQIDTTLETIHEDSSKKPIYQNKNISSSSFTSYKSRIRLPSTLAQQQPRENSDAHTQTMLKSPAICNPNGSFGEQMSNSASMSPSKMSSPTIQNGQKYFYDNSSKRYNQSLDFQDQNDISSERESSYGYDTNELSTPKTNTSYHSFESHPSAYPYSSNTGITRTPRSNEMNSIDQRSTSNSSFQVNTRTNDDESSLFIKPDDFHTITIKVVSTINNFGTLINSTSKKADEPTCTISINDKDTDKEMWRIRKTYSQLIAFDNEVRPIVEYFGLPLLPDKAIFSSTTPSKIDNRRSVLQNYFNCIFMMPHIPHMVLFRICRYLSLDVINPLDDFKSGAKKEGFLVRRYKGLGISWKVRWCQLDGPFLEIYETPGGSLVEQIKLKGSQIGKQSGDSVAEEKGYRHAFLIMENNKSSKLSSTSKHFFCAETDQERNEWVNYLVHFSDPANSNISSNGDNDISQSFETPSSRFDYQDELEQSAKSNISGFTNSSVNGTNDQDSIPVTNLEDGSKDKRSKKRSLFPFRYRQNQSQSFEDLGEPTSTSIKSVQDPTLSYLDQLNLDENVTKSIFGRDVETAFELSNSVFYGKPIPSICFRCLDFLSRTGSIYEEGIFRLSGSASMIRQLKEQFNTRYDVDLFDSSLKPDIHTVAGLFKTYLRELPNPIMGSKAYNDLNSLVINNPMSPSQLASAFKDYVRGPSNMDNVHYDITYVIFRFLKKVIENSESNRMNLRNVCIVFVPTLNISLEVLSTFLVDFECIFENGLPVPDHKRETLDVHIPTF